MKNTGLIRITVGFLMMFGAVGGMEDPAKVDYFLAQCLIALAGAGLCYWAVRDINRNTNETISNLKGTK
jgi:hypothetical protein